MVSAPRLESTGSVVVAHRLKVTPQHMGSSQIRDRTHVPASAVRFFTTLSHQRSPLHTYFLVKRATHLLPSATDSTPFRENVFVLLKSSFLITNDVGAFIVEKLQNTRKV